MAGMLKTDPSSDSVDLSGKGLRQLGDVDGIQSNVLSLNLDNNYLHSLEGVNQFPNLMQLSARTNRVIDISSLVGLTRLVIANLQNNAISSLQGLETLHCLQWISLAGNAIKNPGGITKCFSLTHLDLSDNFIKTLPDLSNLTSLKTLLLHGNGLKLLHNSPPLPTSLHTLTLAENGIMDLNEFLCLCPLKSLRQLSLMGNPCTTSTTADGRLIEYRTFVLYCCPSVSTLDGVATTDVERYQSRMLFFGFDQCPFTIGQHMDLAKYLSKKTVATAPSHLVTPPPPGSSPASKLSVSSYLPNSENTSPNRASSKGPITSGTSLDPELLTTQSSTQKHYPLSSKRHSKKGLETSEGPEILETFQTLRYIQQMIKEQEQLILDQSMLVKNKGGSNSTNSEDDEVGVIIQQRMQDDLTVQDLESSGHSLLTSPLSSQIPRSQKGFNVDATPTSEKSMVKLPLGPEYSPSTNGQLLSSTTDFLPLPVSCDDGSNTEIPQDVQSLASSISQAYGLPLSVSSPQTLKLSSDDGRGLLSTLLNISDSLEHSKPPEEDDLNISKGNGSVQRDKTQSCKGRGPIAQDQPLTPKDAISFSEDSVQSSMASLSVCSLPSTSSNLLMTASSQETIESRPPDTIKHELPGIFSSKLGACDHIQESAGSPSQSLVNKSSDTVTETCGSTEKDGTNEEADSKTDEALEATLIDVPDVKDEPDQGAVGVVAGVVNNSSSDPSLQRRKAAVMIQSLWRGFCCRRRRLLIKHKAAVTIQSSWRGYYCRMYHPFVGYVYREMRRRKTEAYISLLYLQLRGCREELAHQVVTVQIQEEALQSLLTEVEEMRREHQTQEKARRNRAATVIQKHWRGYHTRKVHNCKVSKDKTLYLVSLCSSLKSQISYLEESVLNLTKLVVRQLDLPSPTNLVMSHYSPSCLLIQWDPPSNTPPCTRPLIQWPGIVGYNIYVDGQQEGMVNPSKHKAYIEGLENTQTYQITVRTLYQGNRESPDSNPIIAGLESVSGGCEEIPHTEGIQRAVTFSELHKKDKNILLSAELERDPVVLAPCSSSTVVPPLSLDLLPATGDVPTRVYNTSDNVANTTYSVAATTMNESEKTKCNFDAGDGDSSMIIKRVLSEEALMADEKQKQEGMITNVEEEPCSEDGEVEKQQDEKPVVDESGDCCTGKETDVDETIQTQQLTVAPPIPSIRKPARFFQDPTEYSTSISPPPVSGGLRGSVSLSTQEEGPSQTYTQPPLSCTPVRDNENTMATTKVVVMTTNASVAIKTNSPFPMTLSGVKLTHSSSLPSLSASAQNIGNEQEDSNKSSDTFNPNPSLYQRSFYNSSERNPLMPPLMSTSKGTT